MTALLAPAAAVRQEPPAPVGPAPGVRLEIEIRRDLHVPPEDAAAWDALVSSHCEVGVFVSSAWLSGYFADPPGGAEPLLAIVREGPALRGLAPLAVRQTRTHVEVGLLGGGAGSDRVDLLAARGFEADCADALLSWLRHAFGRRSFVLALRDAPATSPLYGAIYRAASERRLPLVLHPREIHAHPYLDLRDASIRRVDAPPAARNRASFETHRRWLERRGQIRVEKLEHVDEILDAFDMLTRFLHVRWRSREEGSALDASRAARFHRRVLPRLSTEGRLRMLRLCADMRTVAVFYGLSNAGWRGYYLAGYDREWAGRIHLGQLNLAAAIEAAFEEGAVEFDFLKGAEPVKYLWPVRERATLDTDVYPVRCGAQLARAARAARDAAAALTKTARSVFPQRGPS
jgi:CelD/BcsL family acetyltransferase involved in cellulose biosynthesis